MKRCLVNEDFPSQAGSSRNTCLDAIDSCDIFLLVIGGRGGWKIGALYQSFSHVKEETEFRTHTIDRLTALDGTLINIQADIRTLQAPQSPGKVLKQIAPLPPKEFIRNLPALKMIAEQPPANVGSDNPTLHEIALKLLGADEHAPDYWPTTLQFIKFASSSVSASKAPPPGTS